MQFQADVEPTKARYRRAPKTEHSECNKPFLGAISCILKRVKRAPPRRGTRRGGHKAVGRVDESLIRRRVFQSVGAPASAGWRLVCKSKTGSSLIQKTVAPTMSVNHDPVYEHPVQAFG